MKLKEKTTKESPLVKISSSRYVSLFHVDKLTGAYKGHGRPRNRDYAISDLDRGTRAKLVSLKKRYITKAITKRESKRISYPASYIKWTLGIMCVSLFFGWLVLRQVTDTEVLPVAHAQEITNKITYDDSLVATESNVKQYLALKFGFDAPIAWGIIRAESNRNWKSGELNTRSIFKTPYECSVGLFQINLADGHCDGKWIHAYKVRGDTIEDKIENLYSYKYNIDVAYQIYLRQGFVPWSTFADGRYKGYVQEF